MAFNTKPTQIDALRMHADLAIQDDTLMRAAEHDRLHPRFVESLAAGIDITRELESDTRFAGKPGLWILRDKSTVGGLEGFVHAYKKRLARKGLVCLDSDVRIAARMLEAADFLDTPERDSGFIGRGMVAADCIMLGGKIGPFAYCGIGLQGMAG